MPTTAARRRWRIACSATTSRGRGVYYIKAEDNGRSGSLRFFDGDQGRTTRSRNRQVLDSGWRSRRMAGICCSRRWTRRADLMIVENFNSHRATARCPRKGPTAPCRASPPAQSSPGLMKRFVSNLLVESVWAGRERDELAGAGSTISPCSRTRIRSRRIVESRCAMTNVVRPAQDFRRPDHRPPRCRGSTSLRRGRGSAGRRGRARDRRAPPLPARSLTPRSPTIVS